MLLTHELKITTTQMTQNLHKLRFHYSFCAKIKRYFEMLIKQYRHVCVSITVSYKKSHHVSLLAVNK